MKKAFLIFCIIIYSSLIFPQISSAHVGGGPPFLRVNGEYAQTNPLILVYPDFQLNIAQDITSFNPVQGTPVQFAVEVDKLALAPDLQKTVEFKWTWDDNTKASIGKEVSHTFTETGSHVVILEMTFPGQDSYIILDTVLIHSVPHANYQVPRPHILIKQKELILGQPVQFDYQVVKEKSSYISSQLWRLNNNEYSSEKSPRRTYPNRNSTNVIILKVTDSNNFTGFAGIALDIINGEIEKKDIDNRGNLIEGAQGIRNMYYIIAGFMLLCAATYFISRKIHTRTR